MTRIFDSSQNAKFRLEANKCARELKKALTKPHPYKADKPMIPDPVKLGFVLDDGFVKIECWRAMIEDKTEQELADWIYESIIASTQGESAT